MLIPGPGFVGHHDSLDDTRNFVVLGPMPVGTVVVSLRVDISCSGAAAVQVVAVGAAIGSSKEGTLVGINAGRTLIQGSTLRTVGPPSVTFAIAAAGGERRLVVPVGVLIKGGPQWVIVGAVSTVAVANCGLTASVSTLQRVGDMQGGGRNEAVE